MYPKELVQKIHQSLPQELVTVIADEKTLEIITEVANECQLTAEQMQKLLSIVSFGIMGFVRQIEFESKAQAELKTSNEITSKIHRLITEKIFSGIDKKLLQAQEEYVHAQLAKKDEPVVITKDNKEEAIRDLNQKAQTDTQSTTSDLRQINVIHNNLPIVEPDFAQGSVMVKPGEVVHEVPHVELNKFDKVNKLNKEEETRPTTPIDNTQGKQPVEPLKVAEEKPKLAETPKYIYPNGRDPYREPLS